MVRIISTLESLPEILIVEIRAAMNPFNLAEMGRSSAAPLHDDAKH
jgi:hypothetical protein